MIDQHINTLRHVSRHLIRELGVLHQNDSPSKKTPSQWHALIEISNDSGITISKLGYLLLLSTSATSRLVMGLIKDGLVIFKEGHDKREKQCQLTKTGLAEIKIIDEYSNTKVSGAFEFLTTDEQKQIIIHIKKYADALEKSRRLQDQVKILTLSTSRPKRHQIITMIENIQMHEFSIPITQDTNICILKAETEFYYHHSYNFWYAIDEHNEVIGCIGLKKIDDKNFEIKKFFVIPKYRGKKVAHKLIQTLLKAALKHGAQSIYLGTVNVLLRAQHFYKKIGFELIPKDQLPTGFAINPVDTVFFKGDILALG